MNQETFQIDLSSHSLMREDHKQIGNFAILELSKKIGKNVDELSLDHFYDMSDFGGDKNLHVLEISFNEPNDEMLLNTYVFKEITNLLFDVEFVPC